MDERGHLAAAFTDTASTEARLIRTARWERLKSCCSILVQVLADGVRNDSLDRGSSTSRSASFAALPSSQKDRLLDRGFRFPP